MDISILVLIALALSIADVQCINWDHVSTDSLNLLLEPNTQNCLREGDGADVLVTGDYTAGDVPGQQVDLTVEGDNGTMLFHKEDVPHTQNFIHFRH